MRKTKNEDKSKTEGKKVYETQKGKNNVKIVREDSIGLSHEEDKIQFLR